MRRLPLRVGLAAASALLGLSLALPVSAIAGATVTYPQDTALELSGVPVTLTILAGSLNSGLQVGATSFIPTITGGDTFKVRYTGPSPKSLTDGTFIYCGYSSGNNDFTFNSTHSGKTISVSASTCSAPVSSGGGGGGGSPSPYTTLLTPNGGQSLAPGSAYAITWSAGGFDVSAVRLSLSTDSGVTYPTVITSAAVNNGLYYWTVPNLSTTTARIKVEVTNSGGTSLAVDPSNADFAITGTVPPPVVEPPPATDADIAAAEAAAPDTDANSSGGYDPGSAESNTPTINVDKELPAAPPERPLLCQSGSAIKGSLAAVYFCGKDGKRYVFPNQWTYFSWFPDFSGVLTISDDVLASIPLGGNVTYRPGARMVKIQTDPKVYAIARGGLLRWVTTEAVARKLYGDRWNRMIDDVSDAFFVNYRMGPPITEAEVGL